MSSLAQAYLMNPTFRKVMESKKVVVELLKASFSPLLANKKTLCI